MLLMLPGEYATGPDDVEAMRAMGRFNEEMQKAGVLLDLNGLHPTAEGARVSFKGGKPTVTDGPFAETKEVLGGYWVIQVKSRAEAIEWASRCPGGECTIEIRQVYEFSEFPAEFQELAARGEFPEMKARRERLSES
jgi:hypothetical protein